VLARAGAGVLGRTFSISCGMRAANLSLRVDCFDDVDANRVDESAKREGEEDWGWSLVGIKTEEGEQRHTPA